MGGLAVSVCVEPRFTRDIDLALAVADDADAEALVHDLVAGGYRVLASLEQESLGRLATVRLEAPGEGPEGVVVDLLFASSGVEADVVRAAELLEVFPGLAVRVARGGHLLALKVLSKSPSRPQDPIDIAALLRAADASDLREARDAVQPDRAARIRPRPRSPEPARRRAAEWRLLRGPVPPHWPGRWPVVCQRISDTGIMPASNSSV